MEGKKKNILRAYFRWPFFLGILLVVMTAVSFVKDGKVGIYLLCVTVLYYLATVIVYYAYRKSILKKLIDFGSSYAQAQNQLLRQVEIPFAMCDESGKLFWANPCFKKYFELSNHENTLSRIFPMVEAVEFSKLQDYGVAYKDRNYRLTLSPIQKSQLPDLNELDDSSEASLYNVFLIDETEKLYYKQTLEEEQAVQAIIYIDNYEEVMTDVEYVRRSLLSALLERKLNKYVSDMGGVIRKLEKDRFLVFLKQKSLWKMEKDNFSILEDVKTVNIGNNMAVTISIGIGKGNDSLEKNYTDARAAIDMALGRGGDQVVIKEGTDIRYFGGKAKSVERNTRVKARIKAQALRELIEGKDSVMIMGHPIGDLDCLGAAVGIFRAARFSGKSVHIIIGDVSNSVKPVIETFNTGAEYSDEMFVSEKRAVELFTKDTLLVVVDTNRPSYTECPELLEIADSIVVMDHHRQGREQIANAVLSYVEPYASSASEMVAEVIQYYDEELKLKPAEADALFAGIVMDTNNFEDNAGVRTFEAAAYLKRSGANVMRVRKLFRDTFADYQLRAETVRNAELYGKGFIISVCPSVQGNVNQTVIAAQAANELLEIVGVRASFVLTEYENKIFLSARSIDEVNVQRLMEKLGGGGHLSIAGAQLTGITIEEALTKVKQVINEMEDE